MPASSSRAASAPAPGHEDVARAGRQEVGDVEAAAAPLEARDPLLEQDPLDQLGLGEVGGEGDLDRLAARVLGLHLARPLVRLGDRLLLAAADVDERHLAVRAEALAQRVLASAGRAGERLDRVSSDNELDLRHRGAVDREAADDGLAARERADDPVDARPPGGQVDVGLRGHALGLRVRVVERHRLAALLDLRVDPEQVVRVDLEAHRAVEAVARRVEVDRAAVDERR